MQATHHGTSANTQRLLVVDDDASVRRLIVQTLVRVGYAVSSAAGGREALMLIPRLQPHLVITDLNMPDLDGLTLIREVRRHHPHIRLLAISGGGRYCRLRDPCLKMAQHLGAADRLVKPFDGAELLGAVTSALAAGGAGTATVRLPSPCPNAPGDTPDGTRSGTDAGHARVPFDITAVESSFR